MSERQGVEIDYCPQCRGIWLDRGELDKIIERSNGTSLLAKDTYERNDKNHQQDGYDHKQHLHGYFNKEKHSYHKENHSKKKESFLSELFDF
jgi:hypothetical protein